MAKREARVAVVGCGYWGRNLVRNFAELGALEALVDVSPNTVDALVAKHGGRSATFEQVLADSRIDAIVVSAPAAQHYSLSMRALNAGKHVFVEKPLALDLSEAEDLVARA